MSDEKARTRGSAVVVEEQRSQEQAQEKLVLRLQPKRSIKWDASVVDNEHMNKKSSKRCCIFHKPKQFGESDSDESDSDIDEAERAEPKSGGIKPYQRFHA